MASWAAGQEELGLLVRWNWIARIERIDRCGLGGSEKKSANHDDGNRARRL